jgi:hypothetical protein
MPRKKISYDREKYCRYLASRSWWIKREAVMRRCNGRCERCKINEAVLVHHESYIRVYNELLTDLKALCEPCHLYLHAKNNYDPLQDPKLRK